jgi:hypothetical protein
MAKDCEKTNALSITTSGEIGHAAVECRGMKTCSYFSNRIGADFYSKMESTTTYTNLFRNALLTASLTELT